MRNGLSWLAGAALALLAGCSVELPSFVGREGDGGGVYRLGGGPPPPEPRALALREAVLEPGLHGTILRVFGEAPTQGYYDAALRPVGAGDPDAAGILSFELVATPPAAVGTVGPARTRTLSAAVFVPNKALDDLRGFRVAGGGAVETLPLRR